MSASQFNAFAVDQEASVTAGQQPVTGGVSLADATARAIKYNLDNKVQLMDLALKTRQLEGANDNLLPNLVANSGYAGRNNDSGGSSRSLVTGAQSLESSTSTDRNSVNGDLTFSWNILDFGLSYVRAKQAADKAVVADELRRKVIARIIEDVRISYWRALTADRLVGDMHRLEARARSALSDSHSIASRGEASPLTALSFQRELLEIQTQLEKLESELITAKSQLSALMNLPPGSNYKLTPTAAESAAPDLTLSGADAIAIAIRNRPELREIAYEGRINQDEATAALLQMLPGINLLGGVNIDSNSLLANGNWIAWGARASWNLIRVVQYPGQKRIILAQDALIRQRALATTMAIMTQVYVSRLRYAHTKKRLASAAAYVKTQRAILAQLKAALAAAQASEQTLIREEMNTLLAKAKYDIVVADLQSARANVDSSLGLDPYAYGIDDRQSLEEISAKLRQIWANPPRAANIIATPQTEDSIAVATPIATPLPTSANQDIPVGSIPVVRARLLNRSRPITVNQPAQTPVAAAPVAKLEAETSAAAPQAVAASAITKTKPRGLFSVVVN